MRAYLLTLLACLMMAMSVEGKTTNDVVHRDEADENGIIIDPIDEIEEEMDSEHAWIVVEDVRGLIKNLWKGFVEGFMSKATSSTPIRIDDEMCFGEWITKDAEFVGAYWDSAFKAGIWTVTYEDTMEMVYDVVDMIFLQVEYCKFKEFIYVMYNFLITFDITDGFWHRIEKILSICTHE